MASGNIKGITIKFDGDTTDLGRSLSKIKADAGNVDKELKAVNKSLKFNPKNTELLGQKQSILKGKIAQTKKELEAFKQAQQTLDENGVDKNSQEYQELRRNIIETESKLKHFEQELQKVNRAKFDQLGESFQKVGDKMASVGKGLSTKVTAPLAAAGTLAAKKFADVDKTMQLTNATMNNSEVQAKLLNDAMKEAAANSVFGMNDAATASLNFARAGLSAEEAAAALAPAMNLAAGEGGDLDTVSGGLVATINGFHGSFDEAAHYADVFANACNNSALDIDSLSNAMSVAAPIFSAAGYSVDDAALYMGVMADNGIEASKAANSLKTGFARLIKPTDEAADWLDELGISMTNSDGSMKSSIEVQKELHDSFADLTEAQQIQAASTIFGKNQMAPWLALINTSTDSVSELAGQLGVEGTTAQMADSMMSGFGGSMEKLKSSADVLATSFGEALAPMILSVSDKIQKLVDWFNQLSDSDKEMVAKIAVIVAALGPVLVVVGKITRGVGSIIKLLPLLASPVGIVIAVFAALVAAGILIVKNWDKIKAAAGALKDWIVGKFTALKDKVAAIFNRIKDAITGPIQKARDVVKGIIDKIKSFFSFHVELPKIKLPHFSIQPPGWSLGDLLKGSIPHLGIDWYANGGIFRSPSIIGVGEAGAEAVLPIEKLNGMLVNMADSIVNGVNMGLAVQDRDVSITMPVYLYPSGPKMGEETVKMYDLYKKQLG